ncbi:MAG: hypothetical protein ACYC1S_06130 [Gemmatimonadaceae bacterium]
MLGSFCRLAGAAAAALVILPAGAAAQSVAVFGAAEAGGFGQSLALLGASATPGGEGIAPVAQVVGYTLRFRSGSPAVTTTANVIVPAVGLRWGMPGGATNVMVGYAIASNSSDFNPAVHTGFPAEVSSGVTTSAQYNYWGQGERNTQFIASYGWKSNYLWTQARNAWRIGESPAYFGGEVGIQGSTESGSKWLVNVGPVVQFRLSPGLRLGAGGGLRVQTDGNRQSGYARLDFVWTPTVGTR